MQVTTAIGMQLQDKWLFIVDSKLQLLALWVIDSSNMNDPRTFLDQYIETQEVGFTAWEMTCQY